MEDREIYTKRVLEFKTRDLHMPRCSHGWLKSTKEGFKINCPRCPITINPEPKDDVWECQCGCLEFWIERDGFKCCNCETIANFGDIEFDVGE